MSLTDDTQLRSSIEELKSLHDERQKRVRAKNDLLTFASTIDIPLSPESATEDEKEQFLPRYSAFGKHHILWIKFLQDVEDGKIKRLMGLWPPGAGKSSYTSVVFPTHFLGRFSNKSTIVASYGSDLPKKFGRRARSIARQPIYKRIFGTELSTESQAVDEWTLLNGSEWMATGILSGITGNRVDGIICDDLIKGAAEADSKTIRDKTWDAYMNDLMTRKKPGAFEVFIGTRWHEDDPMGRILPTDYNGESGEIKCQDGNYWHVVCLPAEAEREDDLLGRQLGERLWPEWFSEEHFAPFKRYARTWSALFQQRPAPETGNFFQIEWLRPYGEGTRTPMPHRDSMHVYGASDYAVTDEGGNYTVHIVVGVDVEREYNIYVLDLWRERTSPDKWVEAFCDLARDWKPLGWAVEKGQIYSAVGSLLHRRMMERQTYVAFAEFAARGDKSVRAQSIRGRMGQGKVYFPVQKPWYAEFKRELLTFPAGKTDDQVDALGLIGQVLDKIYSVNDYNKEKEKPKLLSGIPCADVRNAREGECSVTIDDLWDDDEYRDYADSNRPKNIRIK